MKFDPISPDELKDYRETHRGRVSYPILKGFLETDYFMAKIDRTGMQQSLVALSSSLSAYIRSHELPIKLFMRKGQIILMRLDIDENGNPIANWKNEADDPKALPITPDEAARRYVEEKDKVTK